MKRFLLVIAVCIASLSVAFAQSQISGKVINASDDEPVIGASVAVEGSTQGTITDFDGTFQLNAPAGTKLVVSFIGMKTQKVSGKANMTIYLEEDTKALDEIIVTGYGTSTRAQFVGSAKAVNSEDLTSQATSNVTNALSGKVAGVQVVNASGDPGTGAIIRIRGVGSINGGTTPLYIVDGAPIDESNISLINSYDIESMTVLKDAASTSIYGARGANGIVLITTKSGNSESKMSVSVDAKWGANQRAVKNYDMIRNPGQYYELAYRSLFNNKYYNGASMADAYKFADDNFFYTPGSADNIGVGYQVFTVPQGERVIGYNFKLNPNAKLGYSDGTYYYQPDDWEKETFREGNLRQEYNINIQGGNKETQYYVSLGYLNDPGLIVGSSFDRFTARVKVDSQVKKWLKIGASATYAHSNYNGGVSDTDWGSQGNVFYNAYGMAPYIPFYVRDKDGNIMKDDLGYQMYDKGNTTNQQRPGTMQGNHAVNLLIDKSNQVQDYFSGLVYATITPIEGLNITARIAPEYVGTYYNVLANPFYNVPSVGGIASVGAGRSFALNQQYMVSYKKAFANIHQIEAQIGWETYTEKSQGISGNNDHLYNPFIAELGNAFGTQPTSSHVGSSTDTYATAGLLANVKYDLMDRYFFNATFRYDATSRFSKKNRWGAFGSVGFAWLMNRESWLEDQDWIDEIKVKASWGTNGNDQLGGYYVWRNRYNITYNSETDEFSKTLERIGNEDLKWESQMMANVGVEFGFWGDRLSGSIEYYNRQNDDMLFYVANPPSSGYGESEKPMNIGKITNQGLELDLSGVLYEDKNVEWSVFGNLTYNRSKINSLPDSYTTDENGKHYMISGSAILKEGGSLSQAYMREYAGVDRETGEALYWMDPADHSKGTTATYSEALAGDLGDISAKVFGGFGTSLEAYGVDLSVQFAYQAGGKAYDGGYQMAMHTGDQIGYNWHKDILNAWTEDNRDTNVPRLCSSDTYNQETCDRWLVSSNFLSLNNITLGYTIPQKWTKKAHIQKVRVFFQGDNLAVWSARQGFDPRQWQNNRGRFVGGSTTSGNFEYSSSRVLSGGISITF